MPIAATPTHRWAFAKASALTSTAASKVEYSIEWLQMVNVFISSTLKVSASLNESRSADASIGHRSSYFNHEGVEELGKNVQTYGFDLGKRLDLLRRKRRAAAILKGIVWSGEIVELQHGKRNSSIWSSELGLTGLVK